jgi:hypothetical protein
VFVVLVNRTQERATGVVRWREREAGLAFALDGPALSAAHVDDQGRVVSAILGGRARLGAMSFDGRLGVVGRFGDTLALSAPTDGEFSVPRGDLPVSRLGLDGTSTPWPDADGDVITYRAALGDSPTDLLWVGEPVDAYLEALDVFAEAMAERVGDQTDWERIQRDFAAARVRGDRDEELALRRRLVRLAALELTVPDRERARGEASS